MIFVSDIMNPLEENTMESIRVKELRTKAGMTQKTFADFFEMPLMTIQNWEQGKRECADYLYKLMEYKLIHEGIIKAGD